MKTEHKKLIEVADMIGYELLLCNIKQYKRIDGIEGFFYVDVREIIFTPEFKTKLYGYFYKNIKSDYEIELMENLDNPVEYLYNLLTK